MRLELINRTDDALVSDRSSKNWRPGTTPIGSQGERGRQQSYKQAEFAGMRGKLTRRRKCECDEDHTDRVELGVARLMEPKSYPPHVNACGQSYNNFCFSPNFFPLPWRSSSHELFGAQIPPAWIFCLMDYQSNCTCSQRPDWANLGRAGAAGKAERR